ncbi:MAG: hypothetical protein AAB427_09460 [Chloroflexota bacterium]
MEEIDFVEPDDAAFAPQPPELVKIESLTTKVYPDGRRVRVDVRLTPFLERPNMEFQVLNSAGDEVASLSIIESMDYKFEMTVHLRGPQPVGRHTLRAELFYSSEPGALRQALDIAFDL